MIIDVIFGKGGERANYFQEQREIERKRDRGRERQTEKHKLVISLSGREGLLAL